MLYEAVIELIGEAPAGLEAITYIVTCVILVFILSTAFRLIGAVVSWIGGK